jgi:hypothetical protein
MLQKSAFTARTLVSNKDWLPPYRIEKYESVPACNNFPGADSGFFDYPGINSLNHKDTPHFDY